MWNQIQGYKDNYAWTVEEMTGEQIASLDIVLLKIKVKIFSDSFENVSYRLYVYCIEW